MTSPKGLMDCFDPTGRMHRVVLGIYHHENIDPDWFARRIAY
ncbi:hypothetical protein PS704_00889 [Pseudomonas fluorescens]|uniref:Uncharacterized protein n=1 Tax=Pseudomonas fluorescens TaxID=294 RepID=A0A5E7AFT7_PSEFL|nr:hypothetical protein PS704_00889 [Pseudomonas fluorescens]